MGGFRAGFNSFRREIPDILERPGVALHHGNSSGIFDGEMRSPRPLPAFANASARPAFTSAISSSPSCPRFLSPMPEMARSCADTVGRGVAMPSIVTSCSTTSAGTPRLRATSFETPADPIQIAIYSMICHKLFVRL
jgi:hypothetical protein